MDTISKVANAASKAIWGENQSSQSHEEPVSGKLGDVAAGEPYDAGNIESNEAAVSSTENKDAEKPDTETKATPSPAFTEENKPAITTTTTGTSLPVPMPKPETEAATKPRFVEANQEQPPATSTTSSAGPAEFAPSATSMREDSTKAQNDTRPPPSDDNQSKPRIDMAAATEVPTATKDEKTSASTTSLASGTDKTEDSSGPAPGNMKKDLKQPDDDSNQDIKLEGPGPRPIEEVAREHGGDAGAAKPASVASAQSGAGSGTSTGGEGMGHQRRDSGKSLGGEEGEGEAGRAGGGKMGGPAAGTGEQYIRSSGLAADGGDFDAARAGAGKEADRLLEQKGVHKDAPGHGASTEAGGKEKVGLKDKIKAKLHKNTMQS